MKVLFCTTSFARAVNGAARFAQQFARRGALGPNIEVHVLTPDVDSSVKGVTRIPFEGSAAFTFLNYRKKARFFARQLEEIFERVSYDCVVFNDAWIAAFYTTRNPECPVIGFIHDELAMLPMKYLASFPGVMISAGHRRFCEKKGVANLDMLIVNSEYLRNRAIDSYGIERSVVRVFRPIAIDPDKLPFSFNPIESSSPIKVLFVKASTFWGRLDILLDALGAIPEQHFELTVIGPTVDHAKSVFRRTGSPQNVELIALGAVTDHSAVLAEMRTHHIFCTPVRFEAMGMANIEASLSGLRLIVNDVGGVLEVIDRAYCSVVPDGDSSSIAQSMRKYLSEDQGSAHSRSAKLRDQVLGMLRSQGNMLKLGEHICEIVERRSGDK